MKANESASSDEDTSPPDQVDALFGQYIDRLNRGEILDAEEIRREHPQVAEQLIERLKDFQAFGSTDAGSDLEDVFGSYRILKELGRGGMGVVYEAHDQAMDRRVALKVLSAGFAIDERSVERFRREARIVGKLRHPAVVAVYATGVEKGTPFIAMEYVEGETLEKILERKRPPPSLRSKRASLVSKAARLFSASTPTVEVAPSSKDPAAAEEEDQDEDDSWSPIPSTTAAMDLSYCIRMAKTFAAVAEGLQHAHASNVIHRDLKPSNLMLDPDGNLRLLDFGLARLEGQDHLTRSGEIVGTPRYMSPEQAAAGRALVDHRTDIYSLGATLYELLTLRPPLEGKTAHEVLSQITHREPRSPRVLNPRIPRDLETIVMKCLRKNPTARYGTAEALAEDLKRFARGDPIHARPLSFGEKATRWARRNAARMAACAVILLVLILAAKSWHDSRERRRLEYENEVAEAAVKLARSAALAERAGEFAWKGASWNHWHMFGGLADAEDPTDNHVVEAIEILERAISSVPDRPAAYFQLARAFTSLLDFERATRELKQAIDLGFVPAMVLQSTILEMEGEEAEAKKLLARAKRQAERRGEGDWIDTWLTAHEAMGNGNWEEAANAYQDLLEREERAGRSIYLGSSVEFYMNRGIALLELERYGESRDCFIAAKALQPGAVEPELFMGIIRHAQGDEETAERVFNSLYDRDPSEDLIHAVTMLYWARFQDFRRGLKWAERLEESFFKDLWRTSFLSGMRRNAEALEFAKRLPELNPNAALGFFLAATSHLNAGEVERGEELARRACQLAPRSSIPLTVLAWALSLKGRYPEALQALQKAERLEPEASAPKYFLGMVMVQSGRRQEGVRLLKKSLELIGNSRMAIVTPEDIHFLLGLACRDEKQLAQAKSHLEEAIERAKKKGKMSSDWYLELARVSWSAGERRRALEILDEALDHPRTSPVGRQRLARQYKEYAKQFLPDVPTYRAVDLHLDSPERQRILDRRAESGHDEQLEGPLAYLRGRLLELGGKNEQAVEEFTRILEVDGEAFLPRFAMARSLLAAGRFSEAEAGLRKLLEESCPGKSEVWKVWLQLCWVDLRQTVEQIAARLPCGEPSVTSGEFIAIAHWDYSEDVLWLLEKLQRDEPIRIDCGGHGVGAAKGERWRKDCFYVGGRLYQGGQKLFEGEISGTENDRTYRTERYFVAKSREAALPGYEIPLPPGRYRITLHFAEIWYQEEGKRVFDIFLEGQPVFEDYQIPTGFAAAHEESAEVEVKDGLLNLDFRAKLDNPKISAIEIGAAD